MVFASPSSLTSAVFLRQVREAPDVAEPDCVADRGQDEGDLGVPRLAHVAALVTLGSGGKLRHRTEGGEDEYSVAFGTLYGEEVRCICSLGEWK